MPSRHEVVLLKLGGSLITDKARPETARPRVIARLAEEIVTARERMHLPLILGHGSGSFGHVAARRAGLHRGAIEPSQAKGVGSTQGQAFELHRRVVRALREAGLAAFSVVPSSCMLADEGRPDRIWPEPLLAALELGMTPVAFGDVVMDRSWGASICSTESLFLALVPALASRGVFVQRAVWLGETDGVLDHQGRPIAEITVPEIPDLLTRLEGAAGTDVTGGIRHRLESAGALAQQGVGSWIGDGRRPGALEAALLGTPGNGTSVVPGR